MFINQQTLQQSAPQKKTKSKLSSLMTMPREKKEKQQQNEEKLNVHNYLKSKSEVSTVAPSV